MHSSGAEASIEAVPPPNREEIPPEDPPGRGSGFKRPSQRVLVAVALAIGADRAILVDSAIAADLKEKPNVTAIEGILPGVLNSLPSDSLDIVLCVSVLEHLWEPLAALQECHRIVRPGGICMFNVPSWRGKWFLEYSAFRLGLSPKDEMNDHKTYYDVKDFWPLLVRAGFLPSNIRCFSHKFGLNTFAVCTK